MFLKKYSLYFAWVLATIGTLGSLYFSQVKHFEPCNLCWYQRIALFPLPILLGIATYKGFFKIGLYLIPQLLFGFFIALYQVAIQEIPNWNPIDFCGKGPNCAEKITIGLGPITMPMLSAVAFLAITILLVVGWISSRMILEKKL